MLHRLLYSRLSFDRNSTRDSQADKDPSQVQTGPQYIIKFEMDMPRLRPMEEPNSEQDTQTPAFADVNSEKYDEESSDNSNFSSEDDPLKKDGTSDASQDVGADAQIEAGMRCLEGKEVTFDLLIPDR